MRPFKILDFKNFGPEQDIKRFYLAVAQLVERSTVVAIVFDWSLVQFRSARFLSLNSSVGRASDFYAMAEI